MAIERVHLFPVAFFILMPSTFLTTYMIAVSLGHVVPELPYISDTATFPPESCIFSQLINIAALLFFINCWIRYTQINKFCNGQVNYASVLCMNKASYWAAIFSSIGVSLVANFQETNAIFVHLVGAALCFPAGMTFVILQAIISHRTNLCSRSIAHFRTVIAVVGTITMAIGLMATPLSFKQYHGTDVTKWKPSDGGYQFHVISTVCEWIQALGFAFFILSFTWEFQDLRIEGPEMHLLSDSVSSPIDNNTVEEEPPPPEEAPIYQPIVVQTQPFRELLA